MTFGSDSLSPSCGSWGWNSGPRAWWGVLFPADPPHLYCLLAFWFDVPFGTRWSTDVHRVNCFWFYLKSKSQGQVLASCSAVLSIILEILPVLVWGCLSQGVLVASDKSNSIWL